MEFYCCKKVVLINILCGSIYGVHDEAKDKAFELELSWVCDESNRQHQKVVFQNLWPYDKLFFCNDFECIAFWLYELKIKQQGRSVGFILITVGNLLWQFWK